MNIINKILTFALILMIMPVLATAIIIENSNPTLSYNQSTEVTLIIWANDQNINNGVVKLSLDDKTYTDQTQKNIPSVTQGLFQTVKFNLRSDEAGNHQINTTLNHDGGTVNHGFTLNVAPAPNKADFDMDIDYNANAPVNTDFDIVVELTNNGTATENNIKIEIQLPNGASTTYSPPIFNLAPGEKETRPITIKQTQEGTQSYIITANGDTQFSTQTIQITTQNAVNPDLEIRRLSIPSISSGQTATITATLNNNGLSDELAKVKFYVDGIFVEQKNISTEPVSTQTVSFSNTFTQGSHTINITVDPAVGEIDLTNNEVTGTATAGTTNTGSGGSSSSRRTTISSSSSGPASSSTLTFDKNGEVTKTVRAGSVLRLTFDGVPHKISIIEVTLTTIRIKIESDITYMSLLNGQTKEADLNGEEPNDISIKLEEITDGNAKITIKLLDQEESEEEPEITVSDNKPKPSAVDITGYSVVDLNSNKKFFIIIAILILLLAGAIIVIVGLNKGWFEREEKEEKEEKKVKKTKKKSK